MPSPKLEEYQRRCLRPVDEEYYRDEVLDALKLPRINKVYDPTETIFDYPNGRPFWNKVRDYWWMGLASVFFIVAFGLIVTLWVTR